MYIRALDGSGGVTQVSSSGGHSPRWSASGDALYFLQNAVFGTRASAVRAILAFDDRPRVVEREAGPTVGTLGIWDLGPDDREVAFVTSAVDDAAGSVRPTFVWVLNWPEIVEGLSGRR